MIRPDVEAVRAFLDTSHVELAGRLHELAIRDIVPRREPADDAAARLEARALLGIMGAAGWFESIRALDWRGCCLARETLAAASPLADAVFALQALAAVPLLLTEATALRDRWLPEAIAGRAMGAFALTEPDAGSDAAALTTVARRDGSDYILTGRKTLISNAGIADFYIVFASTEPVAGGRGISCLLVPAGVRGVRFAGPQVLSAPHPLGELEFDDCRIPAEQLVGAEGRGLGLALATLDRLRATVGAAACGMAARALAESLAHARGRRQFGRPLAEFQMVQGKLARMATDLSAARLLVYRAAAAADAGPGRVTLESAMAKVFATEAAQRIVDDAVQILGGRGVLATHPVDRLYRSVRALRIYEGTSEIQQLVIAAQLLQGEP